MRKSTTTGILLAVLAAALYATNSPFSKLSLAIFREAPQRTYFIALALMVVGAWLCSSDKPLFKKQKTV